MIPRAQRSVANLQWHGHIDAARLNAHGLLCPVTGAAASFEVNRYWEYVVKVRRMSNVAI